MAGEQKQNTTFNFVKEEKENKKKTTNRFMRFFLLKIIHKPLRTSCVTLCGGFNATNAHICPSFNLFIDNSARAWCCWFSCCCFFFFFRLFPYIILLFEIVLSLDNLTLLVLVLLHTSFKFFRHFCHKLILYLAHTVSLYTKWINLFFIWQNKHTERTREKKINFHLTMCRSYLEKTDSYRKLPDLICNMQYLRQGTV